MADVFIEYSRRDQDFVRQLHKALEARGKQVWVDYHDIMPTAQWYEEVKSGIENADAFIFVISPDSIVSEYCNLDLAHAVENNKRIVPIYYRDVEDDALVPPDVRSHQYIFLRKGDDEAIEKLIQALDIDLDWVRLHTRLLVRAKEWQSEGKDPSFLLRGKDLKAAESRLQAREEAEAEPGLTQLQREYVNASRRAATKFRRVVISVCATIALLMAIILLILVMSAQPLSQSALLLSVLVGAGIGGVAGYAIGRNRAPGVR